jgi:ParE toxin of type II toxin-antitoxin system, parDE
VTSFITLACYGCHLHRDELGFLNQSHNPRGSCLIEADPKRVSSERQREHPVGVEARRCVDDLRASSRYWVESVNRDRNGDESRIEKRFKLLMRVRWTMDAADDLERITEHIAEDRPGAAIRIARTIYQGIASLTTFPNRGRAG